jgi:membrane associated rhomboid family serine protease
MWRSIIRNAMGLLAFLLVWAVFPNQWLLGLGVNAMWVGFAKIISAILAAWWVLGFRQKVNESRPDA